MVPNQRSFANASHFYCIKKDGSIKYKYEEKSWVVITQFLADEILHFSKRKALITVSVTEMI